MSSVGVLIERKNLKCPKKKNFQSVEEGGRKKNYKCGISGVRKKNERKVPKRKKIKVFWKKFEVKDFAKFVFTVGFFVV